MSAMRLQSMSTSLVRLALAGLFLSAPSSAEDSPLKAYLGVTDAQLQQINLVRRSEYQRQFGQSPTGGTAARTQRLYTNASLPTPQLQPKLSAAIRILTDAQRTKLPALEDALWQATARSGAIQVGMLDAHEAPLGCWCAAEDAFFRWLDLTSAQLLNLGGHAAADSLSLLTPEQQLKFEALRTRSDLATAADEAARLGLISDPRPQGECLCN